MLRGKSRGVAKSVAAWRERRAMASDVPPRQVLADLALLGIAQRAPHTVSELVSCRGVDERQVRGRLADEILAAVDAGRDDEPSIPVPEGEDLVRHMRPAVTLPVFLARSRMMASEETDLPQPDSPTMATVSPGLTV